MRKNLAIITTILITLLLTACGANNSSSGANSSTSDTVYIFIGDYAHEFYVLNEEDWAWDSDVGYKLNLPEGEVMYGYFKMIETTPDRVKYYHDQYRGENQN